MQFLAGLESNCLSRRNADFSSGAGVASNTGLTGSNAENTESAQFNALPGCQSLFEALEHGVDRRFGLCAGKSRALDHVMDDVLFNQSGHLAGATVFDCTTLYRIDGIGFASIVKIKTQ